MRDARARATMTSVVARAARCSAFALPPTSLSATERLLLACSRARPDADAIRGMVDRGGVAWDEFVAIAAGHRVIPIVYAALAGADRLRSLPAPTLRAFQAGRRALAARACCQLYWERRAMRRLAEVGLPFIVLKGAYLAHAVYAAPYLRDRVDLDLLVPRDCVPEACRLLAGLGYAPIRDQDIVAEHGLAFGKDVILVDPRERMPPIELHWDLIKPIERRAEPNLGRIWREARPWACDGVEALAMTPEDLLLHLCLHMANEFHCFEPLLWFADVDALIARHRGALDWARFVAAARDDGMPTIAYTALALAQALLGTPTPAEVLVALGPPAPRRWALGEALPPASVVRGVTSRRRLAAKYLVVDGWWRRLRLVREHLLPAPPVMRALYALGATRRGARLAPAYLRHLGIVLRRAIGRLAPWPGRRG